MAKLHGYSEDEVDILIDEYTLIVQGAIDAACSATADALQPAIISGLVAASADDAAVVVTKWSEQVDDELVPYVAGVYSGSATQVAIAAGEAFPDDLLPGVPLVADDYALDYLKTVTSRYDGIGNELWETIRAELIDGVQKGQSIEQIKARIMAAARLNPKLAQRIARTEVHSAAEAGSIAQMRWMGYADNEVTKEWMSAHDLRTRVSHSLANGQIVGMNDKFTVGGHSLDYPGDPFGPDDEVINCRCSQAFEVGKPPPYRCNGTTLTEVPPTTLPVQLPSTVPARLPSTLPDDTLIAAPPPPNATACIVPIKPSDVSMFTTTQLNAIFNEWLHHAFSPSYGGKKIHESLIATRAALKAKDPALEAILTDDQILTIADKMGTMKLSYVQKYGEWVQSPAGSKVVGVKPKPLKAIKTPITPTPPSTPPAATLPTLPAVAPKPAIADLEFTGQILSGATKAQVWIDKKTGQKWIIKFPQGGSYSAKFLIDLETALARVQSKAMLTRPGMYEIQINGKIGAIQYMFDSKPAFPNGKFSVLALSDQDLLTMQREQIFDWMISNHDTHSGQWLRLPDGSLVGIDKGQAFKFFGQDKLDWDYIPVTPLGSDKLTYTQIWKAYVNGEDVHLQDPTTGELGEFIERLMAIDDDEYRKLLEPYAIQRAKLFGGDAKKFLDQAVARKNNLKKDFADFWARAQAARAKKLGVSVPTPVPAAPAMPAAAPGTTIKLTKVQVDELVDYWYKLGGGKKVTPAWGGAKIFKMVDEIKQSGLLPTGVTHRQILQELDQALGFSGKTKTYEIVVEDWLADPKSTNTLLQMGYHSGNMPADLKPGGGKTFTTNPVTPVSPKPPPTPPAPTTVATPIKPITGTVTDDATSALANGQTLTNSELMDTLKTATNGDVVGYGALSNGSVIRVIAVKTPSDTHLRMEIRLGGETTWTSHGSKYYSETYLDAIFGPMQWHAPTKILDEAEAILASPTKASVSGLWSQLGSFDDGDVVAYAKMANGDVIRLKKSTSSVSGQPYVFAERRMAGQTSWTDDGNTVFTEHELNGLYTKKGAAAWSPVPPKSTPSVGTKIPGKSVGQKVSWDEVAQSKFLWADGDVVGTITDNLGFMTRIVSDGKGGIRLESKSPSDNVWILLQHMSPSDVDSAAIGVKGDVWQLTADALHTKIAKSPIISKNAGDIVSSMDVIKSFGLQSQGSVITYGIDSNNPIIEFRMVRKGTGISIEARNVAKGGAWQEMDFISDPWNDPKMSSWIGGYEWRAAKLNGSAPDEHELAKIPAGIFGTPKPPPVTVTTHPTKWGPGWSPGQAVHWSEITDQAIYSNFDEYEVIAVGKLPSLNLEYRAYRIGDTVVYEQRVSGATTWFAQGDLTKASKKIDWAIAPAGQKVGPLLPTTIENAKKVQAIAAKTVKKAAKKAAASVTPITTPITSLPSKTFTVPKGGVKWNGTGKAVGDSVKGDEIRAIAVNHNEYDIIAEGFDGTGGFEYRVYRIGDKVFAEQRNVKDPTALWVDVGEFVDAPNFNTVKWNVPLGGKVDPKSLSATNNAKLLTTAQPPKLATPGPTTGGPPPTMTKADAVAAKKAEAAAKKAAAVVKKAEAAAKKAQYSVPPPSSKALSGTHTHVPGKQTGDSLTPSEIFQYGVEYDDGVIIATGKDPYYGGGEYRVIRIDGKTVLQKKTKAGNWTGTSEISSKYFSGYSTKWTAQNGKLTDKEYASAKKAIEKAHAPVVKKKPSFGSSSSYSSTTPAQLPHVDLSPWSATEQDEIFKWIKTTYPSLSSSNTQYVWAAIQAAKWHFQKKYGGKYAQLNEIEILRIFDTLRAQSKGIAATDHKFEIAIIDWLKTPGGKAFVSRRIDAPIAATDVPVAMSDFAASAVPIDQQSYTVISTSEAKALQRRSWTKYGDPDASAKSAWKSYSGPGSAWNEAIRKGDISSYAAKIKAAVNGMRPSVRAMLLHRGTDFSELNDPSIVDFQSLLSHVGQTYMNRGFNSSSVGGSAAFSSKPLLIEIEAPIGTPMAYIQDFSSYSHEREMLLPPHLIYQIISVTKVHGQVVMRVRIIGVGQP